MICSKIQLSEPHSYLRVDLDVDLVACSDEQFAFLIEFYRVLREWQKKHPAAPPKNSVSVIAWQEKA